MEGDKVLARQNPWISFNITMEIKKFNPLNVSSKFAICGLPIRVDSYKTCSFGCEYCFANNRKIMQTSSELQVANIDAVNRKLHKIFDVGKVDETNFLEKLISDGYDWHLGGMSDPLQPIEKQLHITKQLVEITNQYRIHMVISTKTDSLYDCEFKPELHSFQLSVTNVDDRKDIEPNVSGIQQRYALFRSLKDAGFKVGIRVQPFIPNVSDERIVELFHDADCFTIEGLKLVPQQKEHKEMMMDMLGLTQSDFKMMGLLNLDPEIRLKMYEPFIEVLEKHKIPYSIADNDLRYMGTNRCCCGDALIHKSTDFNCNAMIKDCGRNYTKEEMDERLMLCGVDKCTCNQLFASNRQEGCKTVQEFYDKRFDRSSSPFSPKFQYIQEEREDLHNV